MKKIEVPSKYNIIGKNTKKFKNTKIPPKIGTDCL